MTHFVEFPALGWKFALNPTLFSFSLFGREVTVQWYGVIIAAGFLLAMIYGLRRAKSFDIDPDRMIDVVLVCTVLGFVGARLYYVLFSPDRATYFENPISILYIWEGGIGIYGGIIAAFLAGIPLCRWRRVHLPAMMDLAALGFLIGQSVGRWGNFFNQEAFGGNTSLPWGMTGDMIQNGSHINAELENFNPSLPVHPTFLYESLWCLLGFLLLHILSKKAYKFKGQLFSLYLVWYGVGRFFIEMTRTDSLMLGNVKASCFVAALAVPLGIMLYFVFQNRHERLLHAVSSEGAPTIPLTEDMLLSPIENEDESAEDIPSDTPDISTQEEKNNGTDS